MATFKDSNHDGIGDFNGLTSKLGYLDSLGVDVVWLAPFMPSPRKDDGYDVTDYYSINPKFGTDIDFENFIAAAKRRKIKVIMDIVLNHTSIEHPWYNEARRNPASPYHNWYVWADKRPKDADEGLVFPGVQKETWTYDSVAGKYYFHRFYDFQPDLNYSNPQVQQESYRILQYWLKKGVDGYRLDAVPFIIDLPETGSEKPKRMLRLIPEMRNAVKDVKKDAVLLGEANLSPKENKDYFGENNNGMQMMFNFYANQYLIYALASGELKPFKRAIEDTKVKPQAAQWAFFLRNHDETDLARLSRRQRELIYSKFGPEPHMQLYNRGLRRRLAPMLNNSKQLKMAYSLLFSLPGIPVIRYGEEIGMGDDFSLQERLSVRTPMQWNSEKHGGFSGAALTFRPLIQDSAFGYKKINVAAQWQDTASLLNLIKQ
ncbi:MAG TPA: alpha-amylase family protein, partial [Cytophagales bacterium]|nr:alpha-amylase family protein [Cytophagales bacterium]